MKQENFLNLAISKSCSLFEAVIDEFPEYWSAYNNLALAYFYLGDVNKAKNVFDEVLEKIQETYMLFAIRLCLPIFNIILN